MRKSVWVRRWAHAILLVSLTLLLLMIRVQLWRKIPQVLAHVRAALHASVPRVA